MNASKTKVIRKILVDSLQRAVDGGLSSEDGRTVVGLANQITQNMAAEVKVMSMKMKMGHQVEKFGELEVAER